MSVIIPLLKTHTLTHLCLFSSQDNFESGWPGPTFNLTSCCACALLTPATPSRASTRGTVLPSPRAFKLVLFCLYFANSYLSLKTGITGPSPRAVLECLCPHGPTVFLQASLLLVQLQLSLVFRLLTTWCQGKHSKSVSREHIISRRFAMSFW